MRPQKSPRQRPADSQERPVPVSSAVHARQAAQQHQPGRPHLDLKMPKRELSTPGQCQTSQPEKTPGHHVAVGEQQAKRQIWHQVIKRLMDDMHGLKAAEGEAHRRQRRARLADLPRTAHKRRSLPPVPASAATSPCDRPSGRSTPGRAASSEDKTPRHDSRRQAETPIPKRSLQKGSRPTASERASSDLIGLIHQIGIAADRGGTSVRETQHEPYDADHGKK